MNEDDIGPQLAEINARLILIIQRLEECYPVEDFIHEDNDRSWAGETPINVRDTALEKARFRWAGQAKVITRETVKETWEGWS